ncbi:hypothetical protein [Staphylococcus hominis]|uniref:hypothetical protein n=1 Tax=Staphylococcus hominis TaxID=1290 RepID=UPI0020CCF7AF|nr:hypothetical protein [Staphylococcus hominis]MDS3904237.1 hypothetical protein [Staphylococcus hominis]
MIDINQLVDDIHLSLVDCKTALETDNLYYLAYGLATLDNRFKYYQLITQNEDFCYAQQEDRKKYQKKFQSAINGMKIKIGTQSSYDDQQLASKIDYLIEHYTILKEEKTSN